jgi:polysaccharide chain length determinant protein (PEP-CTERM system associated)
MRDAYLLTLRYLRKVWLQRRWAVPTAVLVAIAGWFAVAQLPDVYRADSRVYVDTDSMLSQLLQGVALDSTDVDAEFLRVARRALLSRPNLERVARATDMDLGVTSAEERDRMLEGLRSRISIRGESTAGRRGGENLFSIEYEDPDPERALAVVNELLDVFVESVLGLTRRDNDKMERFLDQQIADYETRLVAAEERLKEFKQENVGLLPGEGRNYFSNLQDAREQVGEAELALKQAERVREGLLTQIQRVREGEPLAEGMAAVPSMDDDDRAETIRLLERQLAQLRLAYTEQHPDVVSTKRRLDQLRNGAPLVDSERAAAGEAGPDQRSAVLQDLRVELGRAEAMVASAQARVDELQRRAERLASAVDTIPEVEAELARLTRDYDIYRRQYEALVQRRESAKLSRQADLTADDGLFQVIEPPHVGTLPVAPDRRQLVTAVFGAALLAGAGLGVFLSQVNASFGDVGELRDVTGLHVLGRVGHVRSPRELALQRTRYLGYGLVLLGLFGAYLSVLAFQALRIDLF